MKVKDMEIPVRQGASGDYFEEWNQRKRCDDVV